MSDVALAMNHITKVFPGVRALDDVSFSVIRGEIHCLVGENGAGKSTLMKILSGVYPASQYNGDIEIDGKIRKFRDIDESEEAGISIIYQELAMIPDMTIYENLFLGNEIGRFGFVNLNETIRRANEQLKLVRLHVDSSRKVKELGTGQQQLVEIARALSKKVRFLILDEPTAALNDDDCDNLLKLILELKSQGVTCILISHRLNEVLRIGDTITVLRDGKTVCTLDNKEKKVTETELIKHMVGREIVNIYPRRSVVPSKEIAFAVNDWNAVDRKTGRQVLEDINFTVRQGEIVGFAGLMGAGRTELARSIFGNPDEYLITGCIALDGHDVELQQCSDAIDAGVAYASEDRKGSGLILINAILENISLAHLKKISSRFGKIDKNKEINYANEFVKSLRIKAPNIEQKVINLSGGNQQKVLIAKWLFNAPKVLILDEPTRGIDVGAKYEIYTLMNRLVEEGMSIIMISSELPELLGMSDRIYVIADGRITGELSSKDATQESIMQLATSQRGRQQA